MDCWEIFSGISSLKSHNKCHKQQSLYFYKNDGSVRNLSSYLSIALVSVWYILGQNKYCLEKVGVYILSIYLS